MLVVRATAAFINLEGGSRSLDLKILIKNRSSALTGPWSSGSLEERVLGAAALPGKD
jgi:hypothetical protein